MTVPSRLSAVTVGARDVGALRAFYDRLGWKTTSTAGDFAAFPLGGAVLCIYDLSTLAEDVGGADVPQPVPFNGVTLAINVDERADVDASIAAAREAGGTVLAEPIDRDWGGRSAYFADPEGNVWEVAWLPDARFDERGGLIWPY